MSSPGEWCLSPAIENNGFNFMTRWQVVCWIVEILKKGKKISFIEKENFLWRIVKICGVMGFYSTWRFGFIFKSNMNILNKIIKVPEGDYLELVCEGLWVILTHTLWNEAISQVVWVLRSFHVPQISGCRNICIFEPLVKSWSELWSPLFFWRQPVYEDTFHLELSRISG